MNEQPSYYSIITANVRYDNRLTDSEKILFAEITSLSNKYGYCTASNNYFAKLYEVTKVTVSRRIAKLKEYGYLTVEIIREGNEIKQRKMYPLSQMLRPVNTNDNTPINNSDNTPIITNVKENNTSINTTRLNTTSINNNSATDVTREQFEQWWNLYGKKKGKDTCYPKFKKRVKEDSFEEIMEGTRLYLKTIKDKQFQKYPLTFLNQKTYKDDFCDELEPETDNPYANLF